MSTTTLLSVEEYLRTSFPDGDREYIDGELAEPGMPTNARASLQARLSAQLVNRRPTFFVGAAARLQISPTRFRLPDLLVTPSARLDDQAIFTAPLLVIEIISPDDRVSELDRKINEYRALGVPNIWIFDPELQRARVCVADGVKDVTESDIRTIGGEISIPLAELFPTSSR